ncbi:hypothetical protein ABB55_05300 [Prosthecomicrobium hirschii]|uniref:Uncharacterized protein n=1 Tax=Prosthecodimorpha hirschii TaxID=665126 RepID=A0A0P6VKP6_9HYPH|nr:hypothetical protein [Prosthecomicrobium hirschii]KPL51714.1 hypothetical protein ABB55_05300 [Prosthecomicrobium hirschii]TPQ50402.1 hypothetical protein C2U72_13540 [Prosthecomicrobium hirschii]
MNQPRLIPLVVFAAAVLLALKGIHLASAGGPQPAKPPASRNLPSAAELFKDVTPDPIITGSGSGGGHGGGDGPPELQTPLSKAAETARSRVEITTERPPEAKPIGGSELLSEITILEKLAERRKLLEQRERELEARENLLKATEGKIEKRIDDLKTIEEKVGAGAAAKEDEKGKEITDLVKMYESMKAKDAARVFDRLDTKLLVDIARQMNPKKLGDVVSKMSPDAAEKLTVELANRKGRDPGPSPARELPKIEGKGG